jgi:sigma-B regulation protein RsbU (phosphoserine phosphatase)
MPTEHDALPPAEALYAAAACGLVLTDADGTIRHANTTFCAWMGYSLADLVGTRRIQDLLTVGGRIFHQTHWVPLLRMQGSIAEVKLELRHHDGRTFPVVMNAVSRQHGECVFHELALFVAEDRHRYERELMHARKQAEQLLATHLEAQRALALAEARLRVAVETAQLHVWHADPATGFRYYDDGVAELLGLPGPEPISAERFLAHLNAHDREREAAAFAEALDPTKGAYRCVLQLHGDDGNLRTVRATGNGVFNTAGELLEFVGVLQDITEMSLQRAVAEGRARFAEQMVGIVSHDLRNPLTAIKMGIQMLDNPTLSPERRKRVTEHMDGSVDRAHRLVGDLLDFTQAKIGSGLTVNRELINVHHVGEKAAQELRLAFSGRTIVHMKEGDGAWWADADRLTQMLGNLVGNAMTYGDAERAVTVTTKTAGNQFTLDVHNWGTPIPAALLPVLFEPMTRGTAVGGEQRSVGLGLFIVKDIVRAHGGRIAVTSSLEQGTTFRTTLPRNASSVT